MQESHQQGDTSNETSRDRGSSGSSGKGSSFEIGRVITTVLVLALVGGGGAAVAWYVMNAEPQLYPVHGTVYLDGKPMNGGLIITKYEGERLGALGPIGEDGRFELMTNRVPGAYEGKHTVTITKNTDGFPPVSLIPEKYSSVTETPFSIEVNSTTSKKEFEFKLTGGKEAPPSRPSRPRPPGSPQGFSSPGAPSPGGERRRERPEADGKPDSGELKEPADGPGSEKN